MPPNGGFFKPCPINGRKPHEETHMTTTPAATQSTYSVIIPITLFQTMNIEAPAGLTKEELCDYITWEMTAGQELTKDERVSALYALSNERAEIDVAVID